MPHGAWSTTRPAGVSPLIRVLGMASCRRQRRGSEATGAHRKACRDHTGSPAGAEHAQRGWRHGRGADALGHQQTLSDGMRMQITFLLHMCLHGV
jgi:hypothetical protein